MSAKNLNGYSEALNQANFLLSKALKEGVIDDELLTEVSQLFNKIACEHAGPAKIYEVFLMGYKDFHIKTSQLNKMERFVYLKLSFEILPKDIAENISYKYGYILAEKRRASEMLGLGPKPPLLMKVHLN